MERPASVPPGAVWVEDMGEWELVDRDRQGQREGQARTWRADGTLASEGAYRAGLAHGPGLRFHPDGSLAREATYVDGVVHGPLIATTCDGLTTERLQSCCVPPRAWQRHADYDHGQMIALRWYDRDGVQILPGSGKPYPPRPSTVPADAAYEEETDRWAIRRYVEGNPPEESATQWSATGVLRERTEHRAGKPHGTWQVFDERGELAEEATWREGRRQGPYRRVGVPIGLYQSDRVFEERGTFDRDQAVGAWSFHDRDGELVRKFDFGSAVDEEALVQSLSGRPRSGMTRQAWEAEAEALEARGELGGAVLAAARAATAASSAEPLRLLLARRVPALVPQASEELAALATENASGKLAPLLNALVRGGSPATLLRVLASALSGAERVALELVDAALLLAPDRQDLYGSRALINVYLGRPAVARADVAHLPQEWDEQRTFLDSLARIVFRPFDFWPARAEVHTHHPGVAELPPRPEQSLEAVRAQVEAYATRLREIRAALEARLDGGLTVDWLPPQLGELLPNGPRALTSWEFDEVIEGETESTTVKVDERLILDPGASIPSLMRLARCDWNALCWLCWSAGLDRVTLPAALNPPSEFPVALAMSVERLWRCRDQLTTSGLRSMSQGVRGFTWEGLEIDLLPRVLAEIATEEHVEQRALFYWLSDAGVQSPWQDNLRSND